MATDDDSLYDNLSSLQNLELAFQKARKGKTQKKYVIEFEKDLHLHIHLENNILFPKVIELEKQLSTRKC